MPGPSEFLRSTAHLEPVGQPGDEQVGARADPLGGDRAAGDLERVLVERGGEQRAPRRDPGPGEVGVARVVRRALAVDRLALAAGGRGGVGDPALRERARAGRSPGPPGGSVGHQIATGESGSSSGSTTDSACLTTSPLSRISAVSPVQPSPVPTWALTCGAAAGVAEDHAEHPRRVLVRGLPGDSHRVGGVVLVDDDDQGHHHAHRRAAGAEPGARRTRRRSRRRWCRSARSSECSVADHGRLQTRPSRASIASADGRPPGAGLVRLGLALASPSGRGSGRGSARSSSTSSCRGNSGGSPSSTSRISRS